MSADLDVLRHLGDGGVHSGAELAAACGVTRAAISRRMARLRRAGWPIEARRGVGYRLPPGVRPLDAARIEAGLAGVRARVAGLDVRAETGSTSTLLARRAVPADGRALLCIADHQTAGRGRHNRPWVAPAGGSLTFSLARRFALAPAALLPLSLVAGVAVAEVLRDAGLAAVALKWPNDVQAGGAKLGGILAEVSGEAGGPARATIGVGLNCDLGASADALDQAVTDLRRELGTAPERSALAGELMARLVECLDELERAGAAGALARWARLDALAGRPVRVDAPGGPVEGVAAGIDDSGALRVRTADGMRRFVCGEATLRPAP